MTLDEFYDLLKRTTKERGLYWEIVCGMIRCFTRHGEYDDRGVNGDRCCPISACCPVGPKDERHKRFVAKRIGLSTYHTNLISICADRSQEHPVRRRLLEACGLGE